MAAAKKAAGKQAITLHDHIRELRNRFFGVAIIFLVVSAAAYNYKDALIYYLLKPLGDEKLIYLNPAGGFSFIFQVTMYVGLAAAVPFLVYNLYRFVAPALPESARKHSFFVMLSSLLLLCIGVAFGYMFAIPGALNFLNNFAGGYVTPNLTADSYLNFILAYTAGLGILFQLPLVLMLVHWIHPLKPTGLLKFERYMILIAFVAAAMITPTPDVMNQLVIALPIIVMYQAGVIAICISVYRARRRARPPKLSRAERKAQKKSSRHATKPAPAMPIMPEMSELIAAVTAPRRPAAPTTPVARIMPPHAQPKLVVARPSQTRRSMDIMMNNSPSTATSRGAIPRPTRPVQHRNPQLQVPQRGRVGMASIDGVSVLY